MESDRTWQSITALRSTPPLHEVDLNLDDPFPALRRLALELPSGFSEYPNDWAQYMVADLTDASLLKEVHLTNWNHSYEVLLPWHQLTTITLDACRLPPLLHGSVDEHDYLAIFHRLCPTLVECTITDTMWDQASLGYTGPRSTHRRFRCLYLFSGNIPRLERRREAHQDFFAGSRRLYHLTLSVDNGFHAADIPELLETVPASLTELTLDYSGAETFDIGAILIALHGAAVFMLNLARLELIAPAGGHAFPYPALIALLIARCADTEECAALLKFRVGVEESKLDDALAAEFCKLAHLGMDIKITMVEDSDEDDDEDEDEVV
ncbi:hypothetical protein DFH09DRAFT_1321189 [Mycena vulgaris]|nr:hypothetical protein DFH09DRAFT_1374298 [Mycena vulgaris]KAJ6546268.1 hypothetical protein DFH09DRAFT_1321189 [Mycena vulgaris]